MVFSVISLSESKFWQWASACISLASRLKSSLKTDFQKKFHNFRGNSYELLKKGQVFGVVSIRTEVLAVGVGPCFYGF